MSELVASAGEATNNRQASPLVTKPRVGDMMVIPNVPQPMFNAKSQRGAFGARDRSPEDLFNLNQKI